MDKERNEITEILLNAALEIIYLLTGEDYTVVKKTTGVSVTPIIHFQESKGWSRTPGPTTEPLPHPLTSKKILELTKKMMELLTGEVPIRCRDVTVDNLTPAWKNIGAHQDLYNDVMMENHRPLTSPDGPSRRNPQKRRPCPLYFQDCPEEDPNVPDNQQDENLIGIKIEVINEDEMDIEAEHPYGSEERNPPERRPRLYPQDCPEEDPDVPENQQDESLINIKVEVKDEAEETDIRAGYQYGSIDRNSRERHPPLLYSQDSPEEDPNVPESHQEEDLIDIKGEVEEEKTVGDHLCNSEVEGEERMMGNNSCKSEVEEEMPVDIATENCSKENVIVFVHEIEDDEDIPQLSSGESLTTLDVHPELHSPDLSYNPPNQEEPFPEPSRMVTTITGVKGGGKQFTKSSRLLSHNPEEKPFSCSRCGKCFTDESNLVKHERIHTGKKQYSCSECGRCFITKARLGDHQSIHTGAKPFSCSECEKCFITKARLRDHERIHTGEKPFSCSKCGMCFTNLSSRLRHERIHTGEKPYSCSECGKCFARKANLGRHERVHTGEKPYSCSECGKCFTTETGFRDHERIHRGEKPFSCSECEKCFITKARLRDHQRFHTGEKPFPCPECGMCFTDKSSLLRHERIHTGEKPYSCSECGKCFINKSDLAKHTRVHTGEKPYSCPDCGKCFTDKSAVVRHKRIHTGEKPYSCPECGKCFTDLSTLVKHERSHTIAKLYVCSQ